MGELLGLTGKIAPTTHARRMGWESVLSGAVDVAITQRDACEVTAGISGGVPNKARALEVEAGVEVVVTHD